MIAEEKISFPKWIHGAVIAIAFLAFQPLVAQDELSKKLTNSIKKQDSAALHEAFVYWHSAVIAWNTDTLNENEFLRHLNAIIGLVYSDSHRTLILQSHPGRKYSLQNDNLHGFLLFQGKSLVVRHSSSSLFADSMPFFIHLRNTSVDPKSDYYREMKSAYYHDSIRAIRTDTITNIKPNIKREGQQVLLITDSIQNVLDNALRKEKNKYFFNSQISLLHPTITDITFDTSFSTCMVRYHWPVRQGVLSGKLVLIRRNNRWEIHESLSSMIQY